MRVRVGCEFQFEASAATPLIVQVRPRPEGPHRLLRESSTLDPATESQEYLDYFGNRCWRLTAPAGQLQIRYDAELEISPEPDPVVPDAPVQLVQALPDDALMFMLPSRYVASDLLIGTAWELFGSTNPNWERVQAICDWIHNHITFITASTTPRTTALDVYLQRYGVCRDFAHLGVAMCRALNIPARYVFGYLPDIGVAPPDIPMDFHTWFEAYLGDRWYTFDARHNEPRIGRVPIGRGRDAIDVALVTQFGPAQLNSMTVWADELPDDLVESADG